MTDRDNIAAQAMQAIITMKSDDPNLKDLKLDANWDNLNSTIKYIAYCSYKISDAMLKESMKVETSGSEKTTPQ